MSPARTRTKSARSGFERINHETTVPLAGQSLYPKPRNIYLHMLYQLYNLIIHYIASHLCLARKHARLFVRGHYLFRQANSFTRVLAQRKLLVFRNR